MEDKEIVALNARLEELKAKYIKDEFEHQKLRKEQEERVAWAKKHLAGKLVPATVEKYTEWLEGFMRKGGNPTQYYDYPMTKVLDKFFLAIADFVLFPLYRSSAINIIVSEGVKFGGKLGDCHLFFMDGFREMGNWVPVYSDIKFEKKAL